MGPELRRLVERLLGSLWLRPGLLLAVGIALGLLMPWVDWRTEARWALEAVPLLGRLLQGAPGGAREALGVSVTSLATLLAIGFSITLLTLQLAAANFTSRLLRRYMSDGITQAVLGLYLGTIAYLLLVLRTIHGEEEEAFVPLLSLMLGLFLTLACLAMLPLYLHHVSRSVQVATLVMEVGRQTRSALLRTRREEARQREGEQQGEEAHGEAAQGEGVQVCSRGSGYLQVVVRQRLERGLPPGVVRARVHVHPGDFLLPGTPLLTLWPACNLSQQQEGRLQKAFLRGRERTLAQDPTFGVRQLLDVALKALSPGINDVTTAVMVLNELAAVSVAVLCSAPDADGYSVYEARGGARLELPVRGTDSLLSELYDELTEAAADHPRVLARLLEVLSQLLRHASRPAQQQALLRQGERVAEVLGRVDLPPETQRALQVRLVELRARARGSSREQEAPAPHTH